MFDNSRQFWIEEFASKGVIYQTFKSVYGTSSLSDFSSEKC